MSLEVAVVLGAAGILLVTGGVVQLIYNMRNHRNDKANRSSY
jgi:uncharacterized membrane protein HdeD (DUF308 family)